MNNDRDRVLLNIIADTSGTVFDKMEQLGGGWSLRTRFGNPAPQFIPEEMAKFIEMPLHPGDIIRCSTNPNHHWGIAEFVERKGYAEFLLREIGGTRLCNMRNESVDVLRFMSPSRLFTGAKHKIFKWASQKAFLSRHNPKAHDFKRCGGVEFDGDTLVIWCRAHIWCMERKGDNGETLHAQPKRFVMRWNERTKLKDIVTAMIDQGFGDDFEYAPVEPTEGQAGYAKITRSELLKAIQG